MRTSYLTCAHCHKKTICLGPGLPALLADGFYCSTIKCQRACLEVSVFARFDKFVKKTATCWLWTGGKTGDYGCFKAFGENVAHRLAYRRAHGDIPDLLLVMHTCDNPICVNPAHLVVGTWRDNTDDSIRKGRMNRWRKTGVRINGLQVKRRPA